MGYHYKCNSQTCNFGCCRSTGGCPTSSSQCVYYYSENNYGPNANNELGLAIGLPVGFVVFVVALTMIIVCVCRRRAMQRLQAQQANTQIHHMNNT